MVCRAPSVVAAADAAAIVAAATQERLRKCGGRQGGDKGISISHSPREPIVSEGNSYCPRLPGPLVPALDAATHHCKQCCGSHSAPMMKIASRLLSALLLKA